MHEKLKLVTNSRPISYQIYPEQSSETIFPHTIFLCILVFEISEELPKDKVGNVTQKANTEEKSDSTETQSDETSGAQNLNSTTGISYA